ncbi:MAG TPA: hypothetical protein VFV03_07490 [Solirubrobacteraceae bacterium]|nr:hypothetical protein [Solirubrobacteraceae bacterium]
MSDKEKPIAKLLAQGGGPLYLYPDRLEEGHGFAFRDRRAFSLDGLSVKVQAMGGGMGHITLRKRETMLTIYGPGVALTRTAKGAAVKRLLRFEAVMLSALATADGGSG